MKIDSSTYSKINNVSKEDSTTSFWKRDISFKRNKITDKLKERFYGDFLTLLSAGVDVRQTVEILSQNDKNNYYLEVLTQLKEKLVNGKTLSEAMASFSDFTSYEVNSVKIGEETGTLLVILKHLSEFYMGKIRLKKLLVKALSYPFLILIVTFGVLIFMLNFVVPKFQEMFEQSNKKLPEITQRVIELSDFFKANLFLIFIAIGILILTLYIFREKLWFRKYSSWILSKIPFLGKLIEEIYTVRFYQFMYLLTNAKHNLVDSINLVKQVIGYYPIENALRNTEQDLRTGESLHFSLEQSGFFDLRLITLIKVAESSNSLDTMFEKLAKQESENVEIKTQTFGSVIEPIFIIFVGLVVGILVISMYMPLLNIGTIID